uniref:tRNA (uracil(54)-C(5))-methyltransferase n=1 Tax=Crassostrea virginica TaxID=6565 RepID=A0A8B8A3Q4_CRAVI|nr:tRNA (uracil-5-)-methyltransferase homolog A-like [Crassostrea virginica]XP_022286107.1 tRNA (uracil-5-)-methyltransferase homolog A-like [Crassostrea virginica]XP_022286108.1 tRNA (uracil-5-)-methyltransferase homolog A-like [Crassostrea virginica]
MEAIAKCEAVTAEDTKGTTAEGEDKVEDFDGKEHGENCPDDEQVETEEPSEEGTLEQGRAPAEAKDPYGYLNREEFTSEIFKIEISNLPRFGFKELKKRLAKLDLKPVKIKSLPRATFAFVTFRNEDERESAISKINGHVWRDKKLTAKKANATADPLLKKRKADDRGDSEPAKKKTSSNAEEDEDLSAEERLKKAVCPLWNMSYDKQLELKSEEIGQIMKNFANQIFKNNVDLRNWLTEQRKKYDGHCCEILPIKPSPVQSGYRNKCEFTIGQDIDKNDNTVGFRFGQYKDGTSSVGEPHCLSNIPDAMKTVVKSFQDFIRSGIYGAFNPVTHAGHWRMLTVRTTRSDVMAIGDFHPQQLSPEEIEKEKMRLHDYFSSGEGKNSGVTCLYFRVYADRMTGTTSEPYNLVLGKSNIKETLLDMSFEISPDAFFQVNTPGAEVLYEQIAEWCGVSKTTTVLDICCGTGTIGLTIAKKVSSVIGIELCPQAIENARRNAQINGITNATYHCCKAEDIITQTMKSIRSDDVVAVVDPPRAGLHSQVIKALRNSPFLKKIIFVSCNPRGAMNNFIDLVRQTSKKMRGQPYLPIKAVPVDMFPQTKHCELVILFQRDSCTQ